MLRRNVAVVVLLALVMLPSSAAADGSLAVVPSPVASAHPDVEAYEKLNGVSRSEALAEMAEVPVLAALQGELESAFSDVLTGLWIEHRPYSVSISVTSTAAIPQVEASVRRFDLGVKVKIHVVPRSYKDLEALEALVAKLELPETSTEIDIVGDVINVYTTTPNLTEAAVASAIQNGSGIKVIEVPSLGGPATLIYGGLGGANLNWSGCPSAFIVRRLEDQGQYTYGYLSAGHCGNTMSYQGVNLPYMGQCWGGSCDSQWHLVATFTPVPEFVFTENQSRRQVWATVTRASLLIGQTACKYGPVTGYDCGNVESKSYRPPQNEVPNATSTFIRVKACNWDMVALGDSGGPAFYGNDALGVTSGWFADVTCSQHKQLIFGSIDLSANPLGVSVWIAPH